MHRTDPRVSPSERQVGLSTAGNASRRFGALIGLLVVFLTGSACTAVQTIPKDEAGEDEAYLKLAVEPDSAELYVDGEYRGRADDWVEGTVPVEPGERRVKVTADGYMTRRFDVAFEPGESKTLKLKMEPELNDFSEPDVGSRR